MPWATELTVNNLSLSFEINFACINWKELQLRPCLKFCHHRALIHANYNRFHFFARPPIRHQKVNHALRLDEEVAAEEEDAEDHGEREHAHHGDLHGSHDEQAALIVRRRRRREAVVRHHRREVTTRQDPLSPVGKNINTTIRLVKRRAVHFHFRSHRCSPVALKKYINIYKYRYVFKPESPKSLVSVF